MKNQDVLPQLVENKIFMIRGQKVMLSLHIAQLYNVQARVLNQAVKRNIGRFPGDFMFKLTAAESEWLVSQNVIPHKKYFGGSSPYAFTQEGIAMLSSVLNSQRAILVNITIMRAFVKLRQILSTHKDLANKLDELERKTERHDIEIKSILNAIRQLMAVEEKPKRKIGFQQ